MEKIKIDYNKIIGKIKPMNAVNNGPKIPLDPAVGQDTGNMRDYANLHIPYARTHDAALSSAYGGEHVVDIHCIFPDFDADVNDPASYDFELTDKYLQTIEAVGTKVFYRLGESIEFRLKKYAINVPKSFIKWAQICEHIIRHYNEGWANGFHMNIEYWEIWNEADGDMADSGLNRRTWMGTPEEFYELYCVAATHLKKCFPNLKIGGPAMSTIYAGSWVKDFDNTSGKWLHDFFEYITSKDERVPLDFFSWHCYGFEPGCIVESAYRADEYLKKYGYAGSESIMNEWNYVKDFSGDDWTYSLYTMNNVKGAAFVAAYMIAAHNSPVDMLMYYDAREGTGMNGLFKPLDLKPGKTYYTMKMFDALVGLGNQVATECASEDIYALSAADANSYASMISYFTNDVNAENKVVEIDVSCADVKEFDFILLSEEKDFETVKKEFSSTEHTVLYLEMKPNTVVLMQSKDID